MRTSGNRVWQRITARLQPAGLMIADASASLVARPWHAVGMVSGILLGVASATAAFVIGDTQQAQVDLRFDLQRSDHVVLWAHNPDRGGFAADPVSLVAKLEPVSAVGELSIWNQSAPVSRSVSSGQQSVPILIADPGGIAASETVVTSGSSPAVMAAVGGLPVAWVGESLANTLGVAPADGTTPADSQVIVDGHPYSVAGVLSNHRGFEYVNNAIVISRESPSAPSLENDPRVRLIAHVRPGSAAAVAENVIKTIDYTGEMGLADVTPPDGEILKQNVGGDLRQIGGALGVFVGLVGMIAIANTLMLSVHNRQRELGLRSAMGWSRTRIGRLILTESVIAGVVAGILGCATGLAAAAAWCWAHGWDLVVPPALPWVVVLCGTAASLVGGLVPALRAASISPLTAMRS